MENLKPTDRKIKVEVMGPCEGCSEIQGLYVRTATKMGQVSPVYPAPRLGGYSGRNKCIAGSYTPFASRNQDPRAYK